MILKCVLNNSMGKTRTPFIWLKVCTSDRLVWRW